jgi:hypothetical protein
MAVKRLEQVERRLSRGSHSDQYLDFMREYEDLGHMEEVQPGNCGEEVGRTNNLPHHFVLSEESTCTKLRVVFDGSAKTISSVVSPSISVPWLDPRSKMIYFDIFTSLNTSTPSGQRRRGWNKSEDRQRPKKKEVELSTYGKSCLPSF